jgi:hypothetical protein
MSWPVACLRAQWFALTRPHALLAVADVHVREMLHRWAGVGVHVDCMHAVFSARVNADSRDRRCVSV